MKAEEVMVGDWVLCGTAEDSKVGMIKAPGAFFMTVDMGFGYLYIESKNVHPIPLTHEMLVDILGMSECDGEYTYTDEKHYATIKDIGDGLWSLLIDNSKVGVDLPSWQMYVSSVHELQHALGLAKLQINIQI